MLVAAATTSGDETAFVQAGGCRVGVSFSACANLPVMSTVGRHELHFCEKGGPGA